MIKSPGSKTYQQGQAITAFAITVIDPDDDLRKVAISGLPSGLHYSGGQVQGTVSASAPAKNYEVTIKAKDETGNEATATFTITVTAPPPPPNAAPVITAPGAKSYQQGQAITAFAISVTDAEDAVTVTLSGLPSGLSYTNGQVQGTVSASATAQDYTVTISANDGVNAAVTATFTITVTAPPPPPNAAPVITAPGAKSYQQGQAITAFAISVTDAEDAVTVTLSGLPSGLSYTNGQVQGTVSASATAQDYTVTISANDGVNGAVTATFTITVTAPPPPPNSPPTISVPGNKSYQQGETITAIDFKVTDVDGDEVTVTVSGLPSGLSYTNALLQGTVSASATAQAYTVTISANDGVNTAVTGTFTITVTTPPPPNSPPTISVPGNKSYQQGETITAIDFKVTDVDGDEVTVTVSGLPSGLSYTNALLQGTVSASATAQAYTVTISANDGVNTAVTGTFTITVTTPPPPNSPPTISVPGNKSYQQGETITAIDFKVTDVDGDEVTVTVSGLPLGLAYTNALLQGTVSASATAQAYTVTISANDGVNTAVTGTFTITVTTPPPPNSPPTISVPGNKSYQQGETITAIDFKVTDVDGDEVTVTVSGLPSGLAYTNALLQGTVSASATAQDYTVTIRANDGVNTAVTGTFTITVTTPPPPPNAAPVITAPGAKSYQQGQAITAFAISVTDAEDAVTVTLSGLPSGLSYTSGQVQGTVSASANAQAYTVTIRADDGVNTAVTATFTITVTARPPSGGAPPADPPVANPPANAAPVITAPGAKSYKQGQAITAFAITVTDAERDDVTVTLSGLPSGLSYTSGQVQGTVSASATAQAYTVTIRTNDGVNAAVTATFKITVTANSPPVIGYLEPGFCIQDRPITPFTVPVSDPDGDDVTVTVTGLPRGLSYANGQVSGTPMADVPLLAAWTGKDHTVTITANDGVNTAVTRTFNYSARWGQPRITVPGDKTYRRGQAITAFAISIEMDAELGTASVTGLPPGLAYSDGQVKGTVSATAEAKAYTVTITADHDGASQGRPPKTATFKITVVGPAVTIADASAAEGDGITFTVTLDLAVSGGLTVTPSFTDGTATQGTDYTANTAALAFTGTAGETKTFTVTTTEDEVVEHGETFTVGLAVSGTSATVGATDTATGTITNDDAATVTVGAVSGTEGGPGFSFRVHGNLYTEVAASATLNKAVQGGFQLYLTATGGTATQDPDGNNFSTTDFGAALVSLRFNGTAGERRSLDRNWVAIHQDDVVEGTETFNTSYRLGPLPGAGPLPPVPAGVTVSGPATGTINDDDTATVTIADTSAAEGDALTFTLKVDKAVQGGFTVTPSFSGGTATKGTDYTENTAGVSFAGTAGETETFTVATTEDAAVEADETFTVSMSVSGAAGTVTATGTATGTITNDDEGNRPPVIGDLGDGISAPQFATIAPLTIPVSDPDGDDVTVTVTGLPAGLSYSDGQVQGTMMPDAPRIPPPDVKTYVATITADDGVNTAVTKTFNCQVSFALPSITDPGNQTYEQGETIAALAITVDDPNATITVTGLPKGLSYAKGHVHGTVAADAEAKAYSVTISADATGKGKFVSNRTFTITVTENEPPVITPPGDQTYDQGETITALAVTVDDANAAVTVTGLPAGLSFTDGQVQGTVAADANAKAYTVTISADDGVNPAVTATFTITVDLVDRDAPTVGIAGPTQTQNGPFDVTITFSEAVTGFVQADLTVGNGSVSAFSGSDASYTATIAPAGSGTVTVDVAADVATDGAGNGNQAASRLSVQADLEAPTVGIAGPTQTQSGPFDVTVTFSEAVTGFVQGDLTVGNGSVSAFSGSDASYTATIAPTGSGTVTVDVAADVATDGAGNGNQAASPFSVEASLAPTAGPPGGGVVAPTVTIIGPTGRQGGPFAVTISFSKLVTGFARGDVTVGNGSVSALSGSGARYSARISPRATGTVTVDVAADVATDGAGNGNQAASRFSVQADLDAPTVGIAGPTQTQNGPFDVTVTFSEAVTGFAQGHLTVGNGSVSALSGSGARYSARISPRATGTVTVDLAANLAVDGAGNGNRAASRLSVQADLDAPTVGIAGPSQAQNGPFDVTVTFSEAVTGFVQGHLTVGNGSVSALSGSGARYSARISPRATGTVTVDLAANLAVDGAGNGNRAASRLSVQADLDAPTVGIAGPSNDQEGPFGLTIAFSEPVTGFELGDVAVGNGTVTEFSGSGVSYAVTITPAGDGAVTVDVAANVAADGAGNGNEAASRFSVLVQRGAGSPDATRPPVAPDPAVVITGPARTQDGPFGVTIAFSQPVFGFVRTDVTVGNGTVPEFTGLEGTYRAVITPEATGTVTVDVPADVAVDGSGNGNRAASRYSVPVRVGNTAPVIAAGKYLGHSSGQSSQVERRVAENTAADEPVGAPFAATDADGDVVTYALSGADAAAFNIGRSSGQLLTRAALDYETRTRYAVIVKADDGHGGIASLEVAVVVNDVDEPPAAPGAPVATEASRSSLAVAWTAPDNAGRPALTDYDVQYRVEGGSFTLAGFEGTGTSATLTGLLPDTPYEVRIRASNDEGTGPWSEAGTGRTLANAGPISSTASQVERWVAENTAPGEPVGAPLTATDADGDVLTYALSGADSAAFAIDEDIGQLLTRTTLDHETRSRYEVTVEADDGFGRSASLTVVVLVVDADEPPAAPEAPVATEASKSSLTVAWTAPDNAGRPALADYDLQYRAEGGRFTEADFAGTGTTATLAGLVPGTAYEVQVRASNDEGTGPWSEAGTGRTLVNAAPVFSAEQGQPPNEASDPSSGPTFQVERKVPENTAAGEPVGAPLAATDADGDALTYALSGADAASFAIDESSGQLLTRAALDHETRSRYEVTVEAGDGWETANLPVAVVVTDVDEPPPAPDAPTVTEVSKSRLTVTWTAPDNAGRPALADYDLQYRAEGGRFTEADFAGTGTTATLTGLGPGTAYQVQVRASNDEGTGPWSEAGTARTLVNAAPVFGAEQGPPSIEASDPSSDRSSGPTFQVERQVAENTAAGEPVGAPLTATDPDGDALTYALSGVDAASFAIDESSGQVLTRSGLDHETRTLYELTVEAGDGWGTASLPVTVLVIDVDEPPAPPQPPVVTESSKSSLTVTWTAPDNTGRPALTDYDLQYRVGAGRFTQIEFEGTGTTATLTGLPSGTACEVQVRASNDEGTGPWSEAGTGRTLPSGDATLSLLQVSPGVLTPAFDPGVTEYTLRLDNNIPGFTVTPTISDGTAVLAYGYRPADEAAPASETGLSAEARSFELAVGANRLTVTVTAQDATTAEYTVVVTRQANQPPKAPALAAQQATAGAPFSYQAGAFSDPDAERTGQTLRYGAALADGSALPEWLTFTASTRSFSGTPPAAAVLEIEVTAIDDGVPAKSATAAWTLTVAQAAPVAVDDEATVPEGGRALIDVLANDTDFEGDPLTVELVEGPSHGTATPNADGTVTYEHDGSETTRDQFRYRVNDDRADSEAATVTVTLTGVNDAPAADAGADQVVAEGATVQLDASRSSDPEGDPLSWAWTQTAGPEVTLNQATVAMPVFTAPVQLVEDAGLAFALTVTDAQGAASAADTVQVTVEAGANDAPAFEAADYLFELAENQDGSGTPVAVGQVSADDPEGESVTYGLTDGDATLFDIDPASGLIVYTGLGENAEGIDRYLLAVSAADARGISSVVRVDIRIGDIDEAGTVTLSSHRPLVGHRLTGTFADPDAVTDVRWQWRSSEDGVVWEDIPGATSAHYTPTGSNLRQLLCVSVTYLNPVGAGKALGLRESKESFQVEITSEPTQEVSLDPEDRARTFQLVLAAVGRQVAQNAIDAVSDRVAAGGGSHATLGGQPLEMGEGNAAQAAAGALGRFLAAHTQEPHPSSRLVQGLAGGDPGFRHPSMLHLVSNSSFQLALGEGEAGPTDVWTLWGRGDAGRFDGRPQGSFTMDGEVYSTYLGIDYRWTGETRPLAGLVFSHNRSKVGHSSSLSGDGEMKIGLTSINPYGRWSPRPGLDLWTLLGYGRGHSELVYDRRIDMTADLQMWMTALGARQELLSRNGFDLDARTDLFLTKLTAADVPEMPAAKTSKRLRLALEARRSWAVTPEAVLQPILELGARWDDGDAESGPGAELAGGLNYADTRHRLRVEARGHRLLVHRDSFEEWGASLTLRLASGGHRGLNVALAPAWGTASTTNRVDALWRGEPLTPPRGSGDSEDSWTPDHLNLAFSYGLEYSAGLLLAPFGELGMQSAGSGRLRVGTRLVEAADPRTSGWRLELFGEQQAGTGLSSERRLGLQATIPY